MTVIFRLPLPSLFYFRQLPTPSYFSSRVRGPRGGPGPSFTFSFLGGGGAKRIPSALVSANNESPLNRKFHRRQSNSALSQAIYPSDRSIRSSVLQKDRRMGFLFFPPFPFFWVVVEGKGGVTLLQETPRIVGDKMRHSRFKSSSPSFPRFRSRSYARRQFVRWLGQPGYAALSPLSSEPSPDAPSSATASQALQQQTVGVPFFFLSFSSSLRLTGSPAPRAALAVDMLLDLYPDVGASVNGFWKLSLFFSFFSLGTGGLFDE